MADYPQDWNDPPPPDPLDPRLGTVLDSIRPTAAERALVAEIVHEYVSRSTQFGYTFKHFWTDRYRDNRWPNLFLAMLEQFATTATGAQGEALTIARAQGDRDAARDDVIEFGSAS